MRAIFTIMISLFTGFLIGKLIVNNIQEKEAVQKMEQITQEPLLIIYDIDKHDNGLFRYKIGDGTWGCSKISIVTSERLGTVGDTLKVIKYGTDN